MLGSTCSPCCSVPQLSCRGASVNVNATGSAQSRLSSSLIYQLRISGTKACGGSPSPFGTYTVGNGYIFSSCLLTVPAESPAVLTMTGTVVSKYSMTFFGARSTTDLVPDGSYLTTRVNARDYLGSSTWPTYPGVSLQQASLASPVSACGDMTTISLTANLPSQSADTNYHVEYMNHNFFGRDASSVSVDFTLSW